MLYINYVDNSDYENFAISSHVNGILNRRDDEDDYRYDHDIERFKEDLIESLQDYRP